MELKLYDTLTREKRVFNPIDPARVRMYVCGPTVYDFPHIGNARPVIVFDVLYRLLRHIYGVEHVTYVRNITDVDDKINARAAERGIPIRELTEETYNNFKADVAALGCLPPTMEPRATEHIEQMKTLIERLVASKHAYVADGHVLFDVPSMPDYGQLSKRPLDEMIAGSRVEVAPYKKDPQDFVLWKPSKPGEPAWPSPCGIAAHGRPGWHIECSAMAWKHLGETFDIHGGGIDLVFPHHENEIAQSRCAFHTGVMANYWMHNGFLQVEGDKMSKSLGNFVTIRELFRGRKGLAWSGSAIRLAMLETHYRQPLDWTQSRLAAARNELWEYAQACGKHHFVHKESYETLWQRQGKPTADVIETLADDLNTPNALTVLRNRFKMLSQGDDVSRSEFVENVRFLGFFPYGRLNSYATGAGYIVPAEMPQVVKDQVAKIAMSLQAYVANNDIEMIEKSKTELNKLGLSVRELRGGFFDGSLQIESADASPDTIEKLVAARNAARQQKNFKESDRIRDELAAMGVVLKDSKEGTTWEIAR